MSKKVLKAVSDGMQALGIEYGFGEYKADPVVYPYFVGEYTETEAANEDGMQQSTFILTGFSRGSWLDLENAVQLISDYFHPVEGKIVITETGSAVAIFYANSMTIQTGDAELKREQINLTVKEWKVN